MQEIEIAFEWLATGKGLSLPQRQSDGAAGMDLCAAVENETPLEISPGGIAMVPCGFRMALPAGHEAQVRPRSGLAARYGVTVLNSPGTIDADYRGEVKVLLINHGPSPFVINRGDRIAQLVIAPVTAARFSEEMQLDETERGHGGFGSTGHSRG
ncbi:deoxyuridine 5'-triphosphate nucleotidohydrolase [Devosia pacifica]|uniref:Deoxyuridine 5'-triphosphate nucleotidohydrolase n=1 Tax=Devosia pacifica TaxID=1335967 RepID=A0A918S3X8_9HYPH|nr:dUTP diphosphatase [Devosia pacifica]GHA22840.1 deoxyuridine 5'-triphosphate nucleotidohydrolase [Devosia pacifica]